MSKKLPNIILCSDLLRKKEQLTNVLKQDYSLSTINSANKLFDLAIELVPDIIIININFKKEDAFKACEQIKSNEKISDIPIIFISEIFEEEDTIKAFNAGAVDFMEHSLHHKELLARIKIHLKLKNSREHLKEKNQNLNKKMILENDRLQNLMESTIRAIVQTVESRDPYTAGHQQRVSDLSFQISKLLDLDYKKKRCY
jgi:Response regulator containing a CheY-like receiver domain and an HD-GYP domain